MQTSFSTWNNEYVAAAALRYPSRCRSMGMVDPLDPEAVKHAIYWMDYRGMSGFRFHPSYYHTGVASDRPGMDRSTDPDGARFICSYFLTYSDVLTSPAYVPHVFLMVFAHVLLIHCSRFNSRSFFPHFSIECCDR